MQWIVEGFWNFRKHDKSSSFIPLTVFRLMGLSFVLTVAQDISRIAVGVITEPPKGSRLPLNGKRIRWPKKCGQLKITPKLFYFVEKQIL